MTTKAHTAQDEVHDLNEDTQKDKYLTFHLGSEDYGIEIRHVTEIIGIQKITVIPEMPDYIKGVINLRGKIIPVMDVRIRFRLPERAYDERTCVVVVNIRDAAIGLVVDTVSEVADIPESQIEPATGLNGSRSNAFMSCQSRPPSPAPMRGRPICFVMEEVALHEDGAHVASARTRIARA